MLLYTKELLVQRGEREKERESAREVLTNTDGKRFSKIFQDGYTLCPQLHPRLYVAHTENFSSNLGGQQEARPVLFVFPKGGIKKCIVL